MGLPFGLDLPSELTARLSDGDKRVIADVVSQLMAGGYNQSAAVSAFVALRQKADGQFSQVLGHVRRMFESAQLLLDQEERKDSLRSGYRFLCQLREAYTDIPPEKKVRLTALISADSSYDLCRLVKEIWESNNHGPVATQTPRGVERAGSPKNKSSGRTPYRIDKAD